MSGMSDVHGFLRSFYALLAAGTASAALVLITALSDIAPPWPANIVGITAIAQLIGLIIVYQFLKTASKANINRKIAEALGALIIFAVVYFSLYALLAYPVPSNSMELRGFRCTADALKLYSDYCPFLPVNIIADANFVADRLWTPISILISRMVLLVFWLASLSALVRVVAAFTVFQRRPLRKRGGA